MEESLYAERKASSILSSLRRTELAGTLGTSVEFLPGLKLHSDPELQLSGQYRSPKGRLLELDTKTAGDGKWLGLHLSLAQEDFGRYEALGIAASLQSPENVALSACLRSGREDGFVDCFFGRQLSGGVEETKHLDVMPVHNRENLPTKAPWRELILFLPTKGFRLSILDFRLFFV